MKTLKHRAPALMLTLLVGLTAACSIFDDDDKKRSSSPGSMTNSELADLELSAGGLDQTFSAATTMYTATVANGFTETTVQPTTVSNQATVTVDGVAVASGSQSAPIALAVGANTITVEVTSGDGSSTTTYGVDVTRLPAASNDANLASLVLSTGFLIPGFDPATTSYEAHVAANVADVTVTPTTSSAAATVTVDGVAVTSGTASAPIALVEGSNLVTVEVTAEDAVTTKSYSVQVFRASEVMLSALVMSAGAFDQAFDPMVTTYSATVPFTSPSTTVTATAASPTATLHVNGVEVTSGMPGDPIMLAEGANTITIDVTGGDGTTMLAYTIEVLRSPGSSFGDEGFFKASNTDIGDRFGHSVAISADGNTLAIGAPEEDGGAVVVNGDDTDNSRNGSGAVYVFVQDGAGDWSQQAYVKPTDTPLNKGFGETISLSADGNTLAVGLPDSGGFFEGKAYVFQRDGAGVWSEETQLTAPFPEAENYFGTDVALSGDGLRLAIGCRGEDSGSAGVGGDQSDNSVFNSGAVYMYLYDGMGSWSLEEFIKASNPGMLDHFGFVLDLDADGDTLLVGSPQEDSTASGVNGNDADDSGLDIGAAYVFVRDAGGWSQQVYLKASNPGTNDRFGHGLALSEDGDSLAIGAPDEDATSTGVGGNQNNDTSVIFNAGAAYVFDRDGSGTWSQSAYVKSTATAKFLRFGHDLSFYGDTLAIAEPGFDLDAGAVHLYMRDGAGVWTHEMRVEPVVADTDDSFGGVIMNQQSGAIDLGGGVLAVGAPLEDSSAVGIGVGQTDDSAKDSGAAYVFE